ncbi:hypothetical protein N0V91_003319 [Didymella pomorum]|uniref:Uncharacterized protein n=1 Tax=Didymella pomorum TaxID=749634 RepID=A0A9W8ZGV4_9PLEO|nr:hypothetical protein N0V91_003319 [Didymella pomorum]
MIEQELLWPLLKIKALKRMKPAHGDHRLQAALLKAADALAAEKTARREHAEWEHVESPLGDALKRAIAANLHAQDDRTPGEGGLDEGKEVEEGHDGENIEAEDDGEKADGNEDDKASSWAILSIANDALRESSDWQRVVRRLM